MHVARLRRRLDASPSPRRAFSIPELAVIVGIVLCVLAVAAPLLLKTQEQARQNTCRGHLNGLARGVLAHLTEKSVFPAGQEALRLKSNPVGAFADPDEPRSSDANHASGASWAVAILPHLKVELPTEAWQPQKSVLANRAIAQMDLDIMTCPSRRGAWGGGLATGCDTIAADWTTGGGDYAGCAGSGIVFNDEARQTWVLDDVQIEATRRAGTSPYAAAPEERGIFGANSAATRDDVAAADGLAWVILLAERRVFQQSSPNTQHSSDGWAWGGPATLMSTRFSPHTGRHYDEADSLHPGLVNVAMADGRVRAVNWNIDLRTWRNLGNYAQGSPLEHPEFRR
jgi:prepilin-type processing-associated H-X9-DG protein